MPRMVDVYLIRNGMYRCESCRPERSYPADGKPHEISGDPDVSAESVTISGPRAITTRIEGKALTRETTMTVAPDDRSATYVSIDHRPGVSRALRTEYIARRIAAGPADAHPASGSWLGVRYVEVPVEVRTIVLHETGNQFTYSAPLIGVRFTAAYGGPFVPVEGPYKELAAVKRLGPNRVRETLMAHGKVVLVRTFTLSADGGSLTIAARDPAKGTTFVVTAHRAVAGAGPGD
jgi:hypothetical protein